jgi:hypothetical protein
MIFNRAFPQDASTSASLSSLRSRQELNDRPGGRADRGRLARLLAETPSNGVDRANGKPN